ncbi:MAG: hypothetical protein ACI9TY_001069 [Alphaproteobacteria bacterium]|jgi:hypothetical protein
MNTKKLNAIFNIASLGLFILNIVMVFFISNGQVLMTSLVMFWGCLGAISLNIKSCYNVLGSTHGILTKSAQFTAYFGFVLACFFILVRVLIMQLGVARDFSVMETLLNNMFLCLLAITALHALSRAIWNVCHSAAESFKDLK